MTQKHAIHVNITRSNTNIIIVFYNYYKLSSVFLNGSADSIHKARA